MNSVSRLCNLNTIRKMGTECGSNFACAGKKIVGAALNYMDVVRSRNIEVPKIPVLFLKPTSSYIQENQNIVIPKMLSKVFHEVELGVVIGKKCRNVSKSDAMDYVAGYCLALDLTAHSELNTARASGLPWTLGKGFDTATPVSRFITKAEIKDPHNVPLWLKVNGEMRQDCNTCELIFKVSDLIEHTSKYMTLEPNDLILTGTPNGAAEIVPGDVVECGITNLIEMKFKVCGE